MPISTPPDDPHTRLLPDRRAFLRGAGAALGVAFLPLPRAFASARPQDGALDFAAAGRGILERHGIDPAAVEPSDYHTLIARACIRIRFGPVYLCIPKEGFRGRRERGREYPAAADTLETTVPAVMRAIHQMGLWAQNEAAEDFDRRDLEDVLRVIEVREDLDLDPKTATEPWTLRDLVEDPDGRRERGVLEKVDALLTADVLHPGGEGEPAPPVPILVLPTRKEMVEFLCAAGIVDPNLAGTFHVPAITGWIHSYYGAADQNGRVRLMALSEGLTGAGALRNWTESQQPVEHDVVVHTITYDVLVGLLNRLHDAVPNWFALGLGFEGVLAQYERLAGRVGADTVGDTTPPRQAFVPGGRSSGGAFVPNPSELRATLQRDHLLRLLERRKSAAYEILEERGGDDPQYRAARRGEEVVYVNFRTQGETEEGGYLHFGPYVGEDMSHLTSRDVGKDVALIQRAIFGLVAHQLAIHEDGEPLARLMAALPQAEEDFATVFERETGTTTADLEREIFEEIRP